SLERRSGVAVKLLSPEQDAEHTRVDPQEHADHLLVPHPHGDQEVWHFPDAGHSDSGDYGRDLGAGWLRAHTGEGRLESYDAAIEGDRCLRQNEEFPARGRDLPL